MSSGLIELKLAVRFVCLFRREKGVGKLRELEWSLYLVMANCVERARATHDDKHRATRGVLLARCARLTKLASTHIL